MFPENIHNKLNKYTRIKFIIQEKFVQFDQKKT